MSTCHISLYLLSRSAHKVSNLNTHPQISFKPDDINALRDNEERLSRPEGLFVFTTLPRKNRSVRLPASAATISKAYIHQSYQNIHPERVNIIFYIYIAFHGLSSFMCHSVRASKTY